MLGKPPQDTLLPPPPLLTCSERPNKPNYTNPEVIAVPPHLSPYNEAKALCRFVDVVQEKSLSL